MRRSSSALLAAVLVAALATITPETAAVGDVLVSSAAASAVPSERAIPGVGELGEEDVARLGGTPEVHEPDAPELPTGDYAELLTEEKISPVIPAKVSTVPLRSADADPQEELAEAARELPVVERDERSTTYARPDGSRIRQESSIPLNVEIGDEWQAISTELSPASGGGWEAETHPLAPGFAAEADDEEAVTVTGDGHEVGFTLDGIGLLVPGCKAISGGREL